LPWYDGTNFVVSFAGFSLMPQSPQAILYWSTMRWLTWNGR